MNIDEICSNMLNGEVIHDTIVIGIVFTCFVIFYKSIFGAVFSIFRKD